MHAAPQASRSSNTKRSAGAVAPGFASSPVACAQAGRGHRRGLDGRVDASNKYKNCRTDLSQRPSRHQRRAVWDSDWRGQGRRARRARRDRSQSESRTDPCSDQAGTPRRQAKPTKPTHSRPATRATQKTRHPSPERSTISLRLRRRLNSSQPRALRRPFAHHCDNGSATRNTYPALPDRSRAHVYRCESSESG